MTSNIDDKIQMLGNANKKCGRLIVRNLPFRCNEVDVHNYFSKYGNVVEVTLLRKNERLIGCGFVQFDAKLSAAKAIKNTSGLPFLGRPIIVDWAVPKNQFTPIKYIGGNEEKEFKIKVEDPEDNTQTPFIKEEISNNNKNKSESTRSYDTNDFREGRTVFFKDIPFRATNEDLKRCAEELVGPVIYALICFDKATGLPKGSGFIKFKEKKLAEEVLNNHKQLVLFGKPLQPLKPLKKEDTAKLKTSKTFNDNRNLYLLKEGIIQAGSASAVGVSQSDMQKRISLEQQKSKQLKNLHRFVSRNRLIIHNLPLKNFDNKRLLQLFQTHSPPGSVITEARVMRNLKDLDNEGVPKSKGFGYVSFENHEEALATLRSINNNPNIFTEKKRPIVSFSIENKAALRIKMKRQELLDLRKNKNQENKVNVDGLKLKKRLNSKNLKNEVKIENGENIAGTSTFKGVISKPSRKIKLPSKRKLNEQIKLHGVHYKKELAKKKLQRKISRKQKRLKYMAKKYD